MPRPLPSHDARRPAHATGPASTRRRPTGPPSRGGGDSIPPRPCSDAAYAACQRGSWRADRHPARTPEARSAARPAPGGSPRAPPIMS